MRKPRTSHRVMVSITALVATIVPLIVAFHWSRLGWVDEHQNYPAGR